MKIIPFVLLLFASFLSKGQRLYPDFNWTHAKDTLIYSKASRLHDEARYDEAIKELRKLPRKNYAEEPGALNLLGLCYYELEQYDKAIRAFSIAMGQDPEAIILYYNRAYALLESEQLMAAASDFAAYAIHFPQQEDVALNLSYCLAHLGQYDAAIQNLERFEAKDTTIYALLSTYYIEYKFDYVKGIEMLKKALAIDSTFAAALEDLSIAYYEIDDYRSALEFVTKLIAVVPEYGRAYYLKGVYEEEIGYQLLAEESYRIAREKGFTWDEEDYENE